MTWDERIDNLAGIREWLNRTFGDAELDAFCHDHFPQIYDTFSRGLRKDEKITLLLDHCRRVPDYTEKLKNALRDDAVSKDATRGCIALNKQGQPCRYSGKMEPDNRLCPAHLKMVLKGQEVFAIWREPIHQEVAKRQIRKQRRRKIRKYLFSWYSLTTLIALIILSSIMAFKPQLERLIYGPPTATPSPTPTATPSPTATPLAGSPAAPGEIVLVVARFHGDDGFGIQRRIINAIDDELGEEDAANVRIIEARETISSDREDLVQDLGDMYQAIAVIWGWLDKAGFTLNFAITRAPEPFPNYSPVEELTEPDRAFQLYIKNQLPAQMHYLTAATVGQIYFWSGQIEKAATMLDRAVEEADRGNLEQGIDHVYLYRALIESGFRANPEQAIVEYDRAIDANPEWGALYNNRGGMYADLDRYQEAIKDYELAIENGFPAYAYNNLCAAHIHLRDLDQAQKECKKAIDLQAGTLDVSSPYLNLGSVYCSLGDLDTAKASYQAAIDNNPKNADAYHAMGELYEDYFNDVDQALSWYEQATSVDPTFSAAYLARGRIFEEQDNDEAALQEYEKAVLADINDADAHFARAAIYQRQGRVQETLQDYIQVLLLSESSYGVATLCDQPNLCNEAITRLNDLVEEQEMYQKDSRPAHVALGHVYYHLNEFQKAIREFSIALDLKETYMVYDARADAQRQVPDLQEAVNDFARAINLHPWSAYLYWSRAELYEELGDFDRALDDLLKAVHIEPRSGFYYWDLSRLCRELQVCDQVLSDLVTETVVIPFDPDIYLVLAQLNSDLGNREEAIEYYGDFLEIDEDDTWVREQRAELLLQAGRIDEALTDYDSILEYRPQAVDILNARADVHQRQGEYELALADLTKALEVNPTDWDTLSARAEVYEKLGNVSQSTTDHVSMVLSHGYVTSDDVDSLAEYCQNHDSCTQALQELTAVIDEQGLAQAYYARGRLYEESGQLYEALDDYDQAIKHSDNTDLLFARAGLHEQLGNYAEAVGDYDRILEMDSENARRAYTSRAAVHEKLGDSLQALDDYVSAILAESYGVGPVDDVLHLCEEMQVCPQVLSRLQEAAGEEPEHVAARIAVGSVAAHLAEYAAALAAFDAALELDESSEAYKRRAQVWVKQGQYPQATRDYVQALSHVRSYSPLIEEVTQSCQVGNTCQEAIDLLQEWITSEANQYTVELSLYFQSFIYAALGDAQAENQAYVDLLSGYASPDSQTSYAYKLIKRCGETDSCLQAIEQLTQAADSGVENGWLFYTRGRLHAGQGNAALAAKDFAQAIELDKSQYNWLLARAEAYEGLGDDVQALSDYVEMVMLGTSSSSARSRLSQFCRRTELCEAAAAQLTSALEEQPDDLQLVWTRAEVYSTWNTEAAMQDYNRAVSLAPQDAEVHRERGQVRERAKDLEGALEDYVHSAVLDESSSRAAEDIAGICQSLNNCESVAAQLSHLLEDAEHTASLLLARGRMYEILGEDEQAIADLTEAKDADGWSISYVAYSRRAMLYERQGDLESAVQDYTVLIDEYHIDSAYYHRGLLYRQLGKTSMAVEDFRAYLQTEPSELRRTEVEEIIAELTQ